MALRAFGLDKVKARQASGERLYHEFLRVPAMSAGLYVLKAEAVDPQKPHDEDEIYVVMSGRGQFTCEGETIKVEPGQTIYVPAHDVHRFHDITQDLNLLVIFAPAGVDK